MSYRVFAKIIADGKAAAEAQKKLDNFTDDLMVKLESETAEAKKKLKVKVGAHLVMIMTKIISRHPDFDKFEAEFPFDDLIPAVSDLSEQATPFYQANISEDGLFKMCEMFIWSSRPCVTQSEPARISLKCWTAYMRGNYEEAEKYAGPKLQKHINEVKTAPQTRFWPVNSNFQGFIAFGTSSDEDFRFCIIPGENTEIDLELRTLKSMELLGDGRDVLEGTGEVKTIKDASGWKVDLMWDPKELF